MDAQKILTILVKEWLDQHGQTGTITIQKRRKIMKIFLHSFLLTLSVIYILSFLFGGLVHMFSFAPSPSIFECIVYAICTMYVFYIRSIKHQIGGSIYEKSYRSRIRQTNVFFFM